MAVLPDGAATKKRAGAAAIARAEAPAARTGAIFMRVVDMRRLYHLARTSNLARRANSI
jgi:hypothetical protein